MATKHTLFLIHGMGKYEGAEWSDQVWAKVVECSQRYAHFQAHPLDVYAEPVPVAYDPFLRNALARWDEQAVAFGDFARANALAHADGLRWLDGVSATDAGFLLSHVADVVIYRFFANEQGQIQDNVKLALARAIRDKRAADSEARFSVMAHSLGTAVAHDALAELGAPTLANTPNTFGTQNFRFESIHMLANVSRVLQTRIKAYESVVRPGARAQAGCYALRMYSHRHELDPFTKPKPFEPVTWGERFELNTLRHYRGWNVHGWLHYLDHPQVHIPLLKSLSKPSAISPQQTRDAVSAYPQFGGDLQNLVQAKAKVAELHALIQGIDMEKGLEENFEALRKVWQGIAELKQLAGATWDKLAAGF